MLFVGFLEELIFRGFLEELIFRGFLFRATEKDGIRTAIIGSAVTFDVGHIANLINGSGKNAIETVCQIVFAITISLSS